MDLSNNDQLKTLMEIGAPGLWELKEQIDNNKIDINSLHNFVIELGKAKKSSLTTKVTMLVSDKKIKGIFSDNDDVNKNDNLLFGAMSDAGVDPVDLIRALYLLANIKRYSGWGKVIFLMQDKRVVRVDQEQGYRIS